MIRIAVRTPHALSSITKGDIRHLGSEIGSHPSCEDRGSQEGLQQSHYSPVWPGQPCPKCDENCPSSSKCRESGLLLVNGKAGVTVCCLWYNQESPICRRPKEISW